MNFIQVATETGSDFRFRASRFFGLRAFDKGAPMFLKVGQAAKALQVSPSKIKDYIMSGRLKAINVGSP